MTYQVHYTGKFYKGLTREMQSPSHSKRITYEVGKTYNADAFEVSDDDCGPGIHVVTSLALALKWGPVVVEVTIPDGAEVVWSSDKLRTSQVRVVSVANLCEANLRGANLYGADLYEANLYAADLYGANLRGANLRGANLYGANLYAANLYAADLRTANLRGADLYAANLYAADLYAANLYAANLCEANLCEANLRGALNLSEARNVLKATGEPASLPEGFRYDKGLIVPSPEAF